MRAKLRKKKGSILIMTLWILVILSMLAMSLSHRARVEMALFKHQRGRVHARSAAVAGYQYALHHIFQENNSEETVVLADTKYRCGVFLDEQEPEQIFKDVVAGEGSFSIFTHINEGRKHYGFSDEDGKINLNSLYGENSLIFKFLLAGHGLGEQEAENIIYALLDWTDEDNQSSHPDFELETEYYAVAGVSINPKNWPLESLQEILLLPGMTPEIYEKIQNDITIYPNGGEIRINFNTASENVLAALAQTFAGPASNTDIADADSLVEKILDFRKGDDDVWATEDDRVIELTEIPLNAKERVLFAAMSRFRTNQSRLIRVFVEGRHLDSGVRSVIEAVVDQNRMEVLFWSRR